MYVESISRLTASEESGPFMRLRPENVNEVFQSLVKMGDVAHALGDDSIPMPTITLTAQTYAETMLTHLRPPYRDVENFAESVDAYDLDDAPRIERDAESERAVLLRRSRTSASTSRNRRRASPTTGATGSFGDGTPPRTPSSSSPSTAERFSRRWVRRF